MNTAARTYWAPHVTVAVVVERAGKLLLVEEAIGSAPPVLNQPAGHLEAGESLIQAACRETLEETAWEVELTALIGVYQWQVPAGEQHAGEEYLRIAFAARPLVHHPQRPLDSGILKALWLSPEELQREHARHRSPLVWRIVADWRSGAHAPLALLHQLA